MMAAQRFPAFRRHHSTEGSWGPLVAIFLLGVVDIGSWGIFIWQLWPRK